ncbi:craniofacial development protein 2-like [Aphis craccivora]|uniref:Craniofacial development protein 2-like n=1 Tax=Aphis craccivora TaxID=307492 RepID=A0A6G0ZBB9_APHCR|nr:craniofacial development protein 2-like [Aphis craccivora]
MLCANGKKNYDIKDNFYEDLEAIYNSLPSHCIKMIVGDLNSKVEKESSYSPTIGPDSFLDISNENKTRLVNFACSEDLNISSTFFP